LVSKTHPWRKSKSRWLRRAAAVSLIVPVRQGLLRDEVFGAADTLLMDQDDMVQKGYGWMLKEATKRFPDDVFAYVMKHKANMPRTALRYAIEKMPEKRRKQAMAK
jgi:3-methyladenine DNA glycosylase AlkD